MYSINKYSLPNFVNFTNFIFLFSRFSSILPVINYNLFYYFSAKLELAETLDKIICLSIRLILVSIISQDTEYLGTLDIPRDTRVPVQRYQFYTGQTFSITPPCAQRCQWRSEVSPRGSSPCVATKSRFTAGAFTSLARKPGGNGGHGNVKTTPWSHQQKRLILSSTRP